MVKNLPDLSTVMWGGIQVSMETKDSLPGLDISRKYVTAMTQPTGTAGVYVTFNIRGTHTNRLPRSAKSCL